MPVVNFMSSTLFFKKFTAYGQRAVRRTVLRRNFWKGTEVANTTNTVNMKREKIYWSCVFYKEQRNELFQHRNQPTT